MREQNKRFGLRNPQDLYTPRCDKHGFYKPLQCPPFIGCHCVDKYGKRKSRSNREASLPNCEKLANTSVTRNTKPLPTRSPTTQPATKSTTHPTTLPATENTHPTLPGKYSYKCSILALKVFSLITPYSRPCQKPNC